MAAATSPIQTSNQSRNTPSLQNNTDPLNHDILSRLNRDGFVIIRSLLSPQQLIHLRDAACNSTRLARSGKWPHLRTLPKQFPPWPPRPPPTSEGGGIWGVQHLLHPDLPDHSAFAELYFGDAIISPVKSLLAEEHNGKQVPADDEHLVMELLNMLVRPEHDFALRWHRDDIGADATCQEEEAALGLHSHGCSPRRAYHAQYNIPLYDDASLVVVPGSHRRARTKEERKAGPFEVTLLGMYVVALEAGDCVFYDNNILHRGLYNKDIERMTLHGSVGDVRGGRKRARNVLQHAVADWVGRCEFGGIVEERVRNRAENMRRRLVELGREVEGEYVGYTHTG